MLRATASFLTKMSLVNLSSPTDTSSSRLITQAMLWKGKDMNPKKWGWIIMGGRMIPLKTDLSYAPELLKLTICNCKNGCANLRCSCKKNGLQCTPGRGECRGASCENAMQANMEDIVYELIK